MQAWNQVGRVSACLALNGMLPHWKSVVQMNQVFPAGPSGIRQNVASDVSSSRTPHALESSAAAVFADSSSCGSEAEKR